jgi:hypothetical protein
VCLDKESGVVLESKADDGDGKALDIKATAYGEPTEADLTPPAAVSSLPGVTSTT